MLRVLVVGEVEMDDEDGREKEMRSWSSRGCCRERTDLDDAHALLRGAALPIRSDKFTLTTSSCQLIRSKQSSESASCVCNGL